MSKSIKINFLLNLINTITGLLFPFLTFPYVSRIIMAEGMGEVQFYNSIIGYIALATCLGIPTYAIREIARIRDNPKTLAVTSTEILLLHIILTTIGYIVVMVMCMCVSRVQENIPMFLLLSAAILLNAIGCEWLYKGIEDFKYITIRGLSVRILSIVFLFLFVKSKSDIMGYAFYTLIVSVGNNLFNFIHLRKVLNFKAFSLSDCKPIRHLKPSLHIFVLNIIISIYVNLDTVMLGFLQDNESVGFYTAGNKLPHMLLALVTSLSAVALPRCANLINNGNQNEFCKIGEKSIQFVTAVALPATVGLILLASPIITIFCGTSFAPSVPVLQWTAPIILFVGFSNIIGIQILYPLNKENIVIWSAVGGALINVIFNFLLIPKISSTGASVATFMAELIVLIIQILVGHKFIPFKLFNIKLFKYVIATLIMGLVVILLKFTILNTNTQIICSIVLGIASYSTVLFLLRDELFFEVLHTITKKIR